MNDEIPKEILAILKAVPAEEEPDLPFKMPKNHNEELFTGPQKKIINQKERL